MDTVTDPMPWVRAVRASHDRLAGIAGSLDSDGLRARSYDKDWSIAQVLSHLGSQAEIFGLSLDAGLSGGDPPGQESFPPIWDKWNSRSPEDQAAQSIAVNAALVARVEALSEAELASIRVAMFGMTLDAAGLLRMRLNEHAVHTWDVAVALDPSARVAPDAVELLIDGVPQT
ncbi:MAG TPA: maleylpyruvate isomerase family mycothiol-dependent enzyme, partial [Trebonia sp.]